MASWMMDVKFVDSIDPKHKCSYCRKHLRDPHMMKCGHHYCKPCIDQLLQERAKDRCPACRADDDQPGAASRDPDDLYYDILVPENVLADKALRREIGKLKCYCPYAKSCDWTGLYQSLEEHLKNHSEHVPMACTLNCGQQMARVSLAVHKDVECMERLVKCRHCSEKPKAKDKEVQHDGILLWPITEFLPKRKRRDAISGKAAQVTSYPVFYSPTGWCASAQLNGGSRPSPVNDCLPDSSTPRDHSGPAQSQHFSSLSAADPSGSRTSPVNDCLPDSSTPRDHSGPAQSQHSSSPSAADPSHTPEVRALLLEDHYNDDDHGGPADVVERASEPSKQPRKSKAQRSLLCAWQTWLCPIGWQRAKCTRSVFIAVLGTVLLFAAAVALGISFAPHRTSDVTRGDPPSMPSLSSTGHPAEGHSTTLTTVPEIVQGTAPMEGAANAANDTTTAVVPRGRCSTGNYFNRDREKCMPCSGSEGIYCVLKRNCTEDTDAEYTCTYSV